MPVLNVQFAHQQYVNSCWAACGRLVFNAYQGQTIYATDSDFAQALGLDPKKIQNLRTVLEKANLFNGIDDTDNIPPFPTVKAQIDKGRPLIICISVNIIQPGGDCIGGHYVIVYGYDGRANTINVIDPANVPSNPGPQVIPYSPLSYPAPYGQMYWGVPYYTKPPI